MSAIDHLNIHNNKLDPYQLIDSKLKRLSWSSSFSGADVTEKDQIMQWLRLLRPFSESFVTKVIAEGIYDNKFHEIVFILNLAADDEFKHVSTLEAYNILHEIVESAPDCIVHMMEPREYNQSVQTLKLLSRNR